MWIKTLPNFITNVSSNILKPKNMKRIITTLLASLIISFLNGQSIDSIQIFELNNNVDIRIEGTYGSTGFYTSNLSYGVIDDKINIDIFFVTCPGYAITIPYDTIAEIGYVPSQTYLITCRTIWDIYLDSTTYCSQNNILTTVDSVTITYNLLDINNQEINENEIDIYPNPFQDNFIIEGNKLNKTYSIEILDLSGKVIKNIIAKEPNQKIELIDVKQGMYFIKILTPRNKQIIRKIIKTK